ncbi:hypothetical protein HFO32_22135 [Rhizobium leguminosarum]|uniref:hypothetical protein n=1 Tax=Rhizobiaceae TaxID=82115 RepID=UPI000FDA05CA|nr:MULTISPECIES: hypothetical protein [Rhizobiaceae]MBY5684825.1 hypothetical protein [Rhizobium leguminosarum]RVL87676.1 hypothetical protein CN140_01725 [Sinorhizobium meliloti]
MAQLPLMPVTGGQKLSGGQVVFQEHGLAKPYKLGPIDSAEFASALTEVEARSVETGLSKLIGSWPVQQDASITLNGIQKWDPVIYRSMYLAKTIYVTQAAVASATVIVEDVAVGDVVEIPGVNPSITSVTDGATTPVSYIEDATGFGDNHYIFQSQRKLLEFIKIPATADTDVEITYSLPLITEADKVVRHEIMKTAGVRGKLSILGVIAESMPGQAVDYIFPDVEFRPTGPGTMLGGLSELQTASLTARVYDNGSGYGFIRPYTA